MSTTYLLCRPSLKVKMIGERMSLSIPKITLVYRGHDHMSNYSHLWYCCYCCCCWCLYAITLLFTDINECLATPCINGDCTNNIGGFTCSCRAGWVGTLCETGNNAIVFNQTIACSIPFWGMYMFQHPLSSGLFKDSAREGYKHGHFLFPFEFHFDIQLKCMVVVSWKAHLSSSLCEVYLNRWKMEHQNGIENEKGLNLESVSVDGMFSSKLQKQILMINRTTS